MMDRDYPTSSFTDPLVSAAQPAAWAYERSTASIKPSLSYGTVDPSHTETDIHRPTYAASHQLPGYTTTQPPAALSGIFDTSMHAASSNTTDASVLNFLSAIESRTPQAGSSAATLLPQFRASSWQTGIHSSSGTELFVTGALPTSGTFPLSSALSAYQLPNTFTTRNFATTPSFTLQDATFNAPSNGLLSTLDPLLQLKSSQGTVPTALAFDRIGSTALSTSMPPQSSTYRSAQESAPHLLQPQFTLLPSVLGGSQQTSQPYSTAVFAGSTASIERALPRECSVIKHHQRPSSTQSAQTQLTSSQHSLQSFLTSASGVTFQDTSKQTALPCSPVGDATQVSSGGPQQKTSQVALDHAQSYSSAIPSPGCSSASSTKTKNCSTKQPQRSSETPEPQSESPVVQTQNYAKSAQNQSSVISNQTQVYSVAQLPSLMLLSQSQSYASSQAQSMPTVTHSQVFSSSQPEKLPSLYRTLNAFTGQAQSLATDNQTSSYSSDQQVLTSVHSENFNAQTPDLVSVTQSQSYSSSHSQGLPTVNQSQVTYSSQSQALSAVTPSQSYVSGHPLTLTSESLPFSTTSHAQPLSSSSPTQNFIPMHSSQNTQSQSTSSPQSQKFLPAVQLLFPSPAHPQTLQNNRSSSSLKQSYVKRKSESNLYATSKQDDGEFPIQDLQALQQQASLESSAQNLSESELGDQNAMYSVSKADDRYHSQSVIRSNSRLEEQDVGLALQGSKKDGLVTTVGDQQGQQAGNKNSMGNHDIKKAAYLPHASHVNLTAKDLKQQEHAVLHTVQETKSQQHQTQIIDTSHPHVLRRQMQLPSGQVLLEPNCEIHMLQQSVLQSSLGLPKSHVQQMQSQGHVAQEFLQMEGHIVQTSGSQPPQQIHPQNAEVLNMDISESSKPLQQHLPPKDHFSSPNRHDSKNQFASMGSMCFPESMLLGDERNILSNVDDILAATCGVASQEFAKSASNEGEIQSTENTNASKSQFQQIDIRNVSLGIRSPSSLVENQQNSNISLNGNHLNLSLSPVSAVQSRSSRLEQPRHKSSDQTVPCRLNSSTVGSTQEADEQNVSTNMKQYSTSLESEDENDNIPEHDDNADNPDFVPSGKSLGEESTASDSDFNLGEDDMVEGNTKKGLLKSKTESGNIVMSDNKTEEEGQDLTEDVLQKKKARGKDQTKNSTEDENGSQKSVKRVGQAKRQNSRGSDASSPVSAQSSDVSYDSYQHLESIRQKIKEVEEKQPEVKTGFLASFLDFIKSGPKQQFSAPAIRMPNRTRRPCTHIVRPPYPQLLAKPQPVSASLLPCEGGSASPSKRADDEQKKNMETLPSFSSDEDDSVGKSQYLQKSLSSVLPDLDATLHQKNDAETEKGTATCVVNQESPHTPSTALKIQESPRTTDFRDQASPEDISSEQLADMKQDAIAIEGYTDEDDTDSGGEGVYKDRDEFVVKTEDIDSLKWSLMTGREPPAIWKVQKALLQKYVPELRDGHREFAATNSYLGYFGDAKTKYKRVYVKLIENVNKKEYVRICSKKPRTILVPPVRTPQSKSTNQNKAPDPPASKSTPTRNASKPKAKQSKVNTEPPPKKRKKWKEISSSVSDSCLEAPSDEDEPPSKKQTKQKELPPPPPDFCPEAQINENEPPPKKEKKRKVASSSKPDFCPEAQGSKDKPPPKKQKKQKISSSLPDPCPEAQSAENESQSKNQIECKEISSSVPDASPEAQSDDDEFTPPVPFVSRFQNVKTMKDAFKSYMELLISAALDSDRLKALKQDNDKLLLPHMNKIDDMLKDNGRRILTQLELDEAFKNALERFPELTVVSCNSKRKCGNSTLSKIEMSGQPYNKKTMEASTSPTKLPQEFAVESEKSHLYAKYHSLRHYKYHLFMICKQKIASVQYRYKDLGHEEIIKQCLKNKLWMENLFEQFSELLNPVHLKCL